MSPLFFVSFLCFWETLQRLTLNMGVWHACTSRVPHYLPSICICQLLQLLCNFWYAGNSCYIFRGEHEEDCCLEVFNNFPVSEHLTSRPWNSKRLCPVDWCQGWRGPTVPGRRRAFCGQCGTLRHLVQKWALKELLGNIKKCFPASGKFLLKHFVIFYSSYSSFGLIHHRKVLPSCLQGQVNPEFFCSLCCVPNFIIYEHSGKFYLGA